MNLDREKEKRKKTLAGKFDQMRVLVCWLRPLFFIERFLEAESQRTKTF